MKKKNKSADKNKNSNSKSKAKAAPPVEKVYAQVVQPENPNVDAQIITKIKNRTLSEEDAKIMAKVIERMMKS